MQIHLAAVTVDDQEKALQFYTNVLGFEKDKDIPMGPYRWLTVRAPEGLPGVELVLEPIGFPPAAVYQKARYEAGVPSYAFFSADLATEYQKLVERGVQFRGEPKDMGPVIVATFDDTCGNLMNLVQPKG
jgi:predicted enzyme related to lactoylglutathione lyase